LELAVTVVNCPQCGAEVAVPDTAANATLSSICPSCKSSIEISIEFDGAETLLQPQLQKGTSGPKSIDPSVTVSVGLTTSILEEHSLEAEDPTISTVPQASLVVLGADPGTGLFVVSSGATTVGREGTDIVIADDTISSRHCEIEARGGEFFLRDLDSSNGTFVNDERIRSVQLSSGDRIRIGQSLLAFKIVEAIALEPGD